MDEKNDKLYLTAEDYRTAQENQPEPEPEKAPEQAEDVPLNLETTRRFAQVLEKETSLMEDERAVEELQHMQKTTESISAWLEAHPESLPKPPLCGILYPHYPQAPAHLQRRAGPAGRERRGHPQGHRGHPAHPESATTTFTISFCRTWRWTFPARSLRCRGCWPTMVWPGRKCDDLPGLEHQKVDRAALKELTAAIAQAEKEMQQMGDEYVSTEHLLIGIAASKPNQSAEILEKNGVTAASLRKAVPGVRGGAKVTSRTRKARTRP